MNVHSWLKIAKTKIAHLDAELILSFVLKKDRTFLHAHPEFLINPRIAQKLAKLLARRENQEPLAYILAYKDFYSRRFYVNKNTLIPRPETETIIDLAKNLKAQSIIDLGTGSGCIAITLALEMPNAKITATDICRKALAVASKNAKNLQAETHINFLQSDLLSAPELKNQKFDLICANLPYVDQNWDWNSPELRYEPPKALYIDNQGLSLIFNFLNQANAHLQKFGTILLEADQYQHGKIIKYAQSQNFKHINTDGLILTLRVYP